MVGVEKRVIVISDTHMGSEQFNHDDLCEFLEWIPSLRDSPKTVPCKKIKDGEGNSVDTDVTLKEPGKLILLGDILEFWDPICQNRDFSLIYSAKPFTLIENLPCEKVYVIGNHDEDLSDLDKAIIGLKFKECKKPDVKGGMKSLVYNTLKLKIYDRHYPRKKNGIAHGEQIGKWNYFYLHGHQFDKIQVTKTISDILKTRFDPIDYFQDLVNVSFTKEMYSGNKKSILGFIFWFVVWLGLGYKVDYYFSNSFSGFILSLIPFLFLTLFVLASLLPKFVTSLQRKVWDKLFKVKDETAQEVVEGSFMARPDKINADVVVFGHTHLASNYFLKAGWKLKGLRKIKKLFGLIKPEEEGRKKMFVNTGGWVKVNQDDGAPRDVNTFAYIDETGIYLLKWEGKDKVPTCIDGFSSVS